MICRWHAVICIMLSVIVVPASAADRITLTKVFGSAKHAAIEPVLSDIYAGLGVDVSFVEMSGRRSLIESASGRTSGTIARVGTVGETYADLIPIETPVAWLETTAFGSPDTVAGIGTVEDLDGLTVGIVLGMGDPEAIGAEARNVVAAPNAVSMFRMLELGRIDVALISVFEGLAYVACRGLSGTIAASEPLVRQPLYHFLHQQHAELALKVNDILEAMDERGELARAVHDSQRALLRRHAVDLPPEQRSPYACMRYAL